MTRHAVSLVFNIPLSYGARIQSIPGVQRVAGVSWFGGSLPAKKEETKTDEDSSTTDFSNFFPNLAVEPEPFFAMYPEYVLPPGQYQDFMGELRGAIIGRKLADRFGWKVGDTFYLESFIPPYRKADGPFEFIVKGIFDTDPVKYPGTDTNLMVFNFKYLYEATGRRLGAGTFYTEIADPEKAGEASRAIDALFENSDAQTRTETEKAFAASFVAMAGNLTLLLNGIGLAVTFTILLVVANTMSIAVRERRKEIAVLKTLGLHEQAGDGPDRGRVGPHRRARRRAGDRREPGADVAPDPRARDPGRPGRPRPVLAVPPAPGRGPRLRQRGLPGLRRRASSRPSTPTARGSPTC